MSRPEPGIRRHRLPDEWARKGFVLATDISPKILEFTDRTARSEGYTNVETQVVDGEGIDIDGGFDAVISRDEAHLFSGPAESAARDAASLQAPGPDRSDCLRHRRVPINSFLFPCRSFAVAPICHLRSQGSRAHSVSGGEGVLRNPLLQAGFQDIQERRIPAPLKMKSTTDCVCFEKESFGALHAMLASLDQVGKKRHGKKLPMNFRDLKARPALNDAANQSSCRDRQADSPS
jgi:hypothetical protein